MELSARDMPEILTKRAIYIGIKENCFGIANGQIHQFFSKLSAWDKPIFSFLDDNLSKLVL